MHSYITYDQWFIFYKEKSLKGKLPEFVDFAYEVCKAAWQAGQTHKLADLDGPIIGDSYCGG